MNDFPVRKKMRLNGYDYSSAGSYFITICVQDHRELLGKVIVGDGVLDVPCVQLSEYGQLVQTRLIEIATHSVNLSIPKFVIMPNHIHMIIDVHTEESGTSRTPSPTNAVVPALISALKRFAHKDCGFALFQRAYHDRIIRSEAEYLKIWQYIDTNPAKWEEDCYCIVPS